MSYLELIGKNESDLNKEFNDYLKGDNESFYFDDFIDFLLSDPKN